MTKLSPLQQQADQDLNIIALLTGLSFTGYLFYLRATTSPYSSNLHPRLDPFSCPCHMPICCSRIRDRLGNDSPQRKLENIWFGNQKFLSDTDLSSLASFSLVLQEKFITTSPSNPSL